VTKRYVDADPGVLRALAHPLRSALLYELHARGAANGRILADATGKPLNVVCFHLGQLARYGLIESAPGHADDRRERWWQPAATEGLHITKQATDASPEAQSAFRAFRRRSEAFWHEAIARLFGPHEDSGQVWLSNDVPLYLTDDEARQYTAELTAVMRRWLEHGRHAPHVEGEDRRTYLTLAFTMPYAQGTD
jgi:hypothetical protein